MTDEQRKHLEAAFGSVTPEPYRAFDDGTAIWVYAMTYGKGQSPSTP